MDGYFLTDKGKVRNHNEDAGGFFQNPTGQHLAVIADGMGGHKAGDVASQMTVSQLKAKWEHTGYFAMPEHAENWLVNTVNEVNESVLAYARENPDCLGMGTTVVAVICSDEFITSAHIGDSRCYLANDEGTKQVTEDHSLVNELVRSGQITKKEAEHHPRKNVLLKALGTESGVEADVISIGWEAGNKLLLCTDGLTNKVTDTELASYIEKQEKLENTAKKLISLANERGGEDNISVVLIQHSQANEEVGS